MVNGIYNGKGVLIFSNGVIGEGDFVDGVMNGKGKMTWKTGEKYDGNWLKGEKTGYCKWSFPNGDIYEGYVVNGTYNGKGIYRQKNGAVYEGDWLKGEKTGNCKWFLSNGDIYEGDVSGGKYNGKGKYQWKNGDVYDGDWENGINTGNCNWTFSNGVIYEGSVFNGKYNGKGKMIWKTGEIYDGNWLKGEKTGNCKWSFPNGDIYEGSVVNGTFNGKGIKIQFNGNVYEGDWKNGKKDGKGIYRQKNGAVYEGDWSNDQNTGKGKYIFSNGDVYIGDFVNNEFHGKGKFQWSNGDIYEGDWVHDQMSGNSQIIRAKTQKQNYTENQTNNYTDKSLNFQNNYERNQNNFPVNSIEDFDEKINYKTEWIAKEIDRFMYPDFIKLDFYFRPSWRYQEDKTEIMDRLYYEKKPYTGAYIYRSSRTNETDRRHYKDGYLDGKSTIYFNDVEIAEFNYKEGRRYGLQQEYYKNGKKKQYGDLVNGNGILTEWHEDGKIAKLSTYKNGLLNGVQKEFSSIFENELISELNYKDGKLDGRANDRGRLIGNYSNGKFNGIQIVSDFNNEFEVLFSMDTFKLIIKSKKHINKYIPGEKKIEHVFGLYNKNHLLGIESTYAKKDTNFYLQSQGKIIRTSLNFTEDEVVDYINACGANRREDFILEEVKKAWNGYVFCKISKDSIWKTWHPNGQLETFGNYTNNLKNGIWKEWHSNGLLASSGTYISDQKNGYWKSYNAAGQLISDENYSNGKKNGLFNKYFENGKLMSSENYINEVKNGIWKTYNENGIVAKQESYKNGLKDGIWITRHNNGIKSSEATYKDGALVGEFKRFDEKGNLIKPPVVSNNKVNQSNSNSSQNYSQVKEKCFHCNGMGQCPKCNEIFNCTYYIHGGLNGGHYETRPETKPGYVMCTNCLGSGYSKGYWENSTHDKKCYVNSCINGWIRCSECLSNELGKCWDCHGSGYDE